MEHYYKTILEPGNSVRGNPSLVSQITLFTRNFESVISTIRSEIKEAVERQAAGEGRSPVTEFYIQTLLDDADYDSVVDLYNSFFMDRESKLAELDKRARVLGQILPDSLKQKRANYLYL